MQTFIGILDEIARIEEVVNRNEDFTNTLDTLRDVTQKLLGFRWESQGNNKSTKFFDNKKI
jgi:hypothetical protein